MRRGSPPEWRRVGGSKVQSVLEMHLARFRTPNGGYDPAAFDREATEQLSMIRPETIIRLHVDSTLPCQEFPPPFGPEHNVEIVGQLGYVNAVWEDLLAGGGEPDRPSAA